MTLMRFDPFRELDRLADQALTSARTPRTMPMEAFRRGDQFIVAIDVPGVNQDDVDANLCAKRATRSSSMRGRRASSVDSFFSGTTSIRIS